MDLPQDVFKWLARYRAEGESLERRVGLKLRPVAVAEQQEGKIVEPRVDRRLKRSPGPRPSRRKAVVRLQRFEKEALDILAIPSTSQETEAFAAVDTVWSDGYDPSNPDAMAHVGEPFFCPYTPQSPSLNRRIHINAVGKGFRWGAGIEQGAGATRPLGGHKTAGMKFDYGPGRFDFFESVLTHEARHTLQAKVTDDVAAVNDGDHDKFITALTINGATLLNGQRILDATSVLTGGTNPEFNLHGQDPTSATEDCYAHLQALERDAILNRRDAQRSEFQLAGIAAPVAPVDIPAAQRGIANIATIDKAGMTGSNSQFFFWGNIASADVVSGGCLVDDGVGSPASTALVPVYVNYYRMWVTTPSAPGTTCTINLTPYLPTDGSGAPLTAGNTQSVTIAIVP